MKTPGKNDVDSFEENSNGSRWPLGVMLRAAADGELPEKLNDRLRSSSEACESSDARIAFERNLRSACARVLQPDTEEAPAASAELHATIGRIASAARAATNTAVHPATKREASAAGRRRAARRLGWIALTAITLVVGVAVGMKLAAPAPTFLTSPERARIALTGFLESEHRRCTLNERALKNKMTEYTLSEVPTKFAGLLGAELSVASVQRAGYQFLGCGRCAVPGRGESVHLIFRDSSRPALTSEQRAALKNGDDAQLSLFIQSDTDELPIDANTTYRLETGLGEPLVLIWRRDGLVYYLVTETEAAQDRAIESLDLEHASEVL